MESLKSLPAIAIQSVKKLPGNAVHTVKVVKKDAVDFAKDFAHECNPFDCAPTNKEHLLNIVQIVRGRFQIPYFPPFHRPGWATRYIVGPYDAEWLELMAGDLWAGFVISLFSIPQGLSYATIALLPPINGLYTNVLCALVYKFLGSSMYMSVGTVALASLLTAQALTQLHVDTSNYTSAVNGAGQLCVAIGIILSAGSVLKLGYLINLIAHPVMSGFTTAAAFVIGINQLKNAFGFSNSPPLFEDVPQQGQPGYEYNFLVMRWFKENWNGTYQVNGAMIASNKSYKSWAGKHYRNFQATKITLGLYFPLIFLQVLKSNIKATPERKKAIWYNIFSFICITSPLVAIIIGSHVAQQIKHNDHYADTRKLYVHNFYSQKLKIVGAVTPGLAFFRTPAFELEWGAVFQSAIPLALIAFMEGYCVARRLAVVTGTLHILDECQELWAIGVSNFVGCISSGYPVSGSFSRSSLNYVSGAYTPFSGFLTVVVILLALSYLTKAFFFIPQAALAAVVWAAIYQLVSISDFWHAWVHSKKDFFIMLVAFIFVFVLETGSGLGIGVGVSVIIYLAEVVASSRNDPVVITCTSKEGDVQVVRMETDLCFLTAARLKQAVSPLITQKPQKPDENAASHKRYFFAVTSTFDYFLSPSTETSVDVLPAALVLDLSHVRITDLTGIQAVGELQLEARLQRILFVVTGATPVVAAQLKKFGIKNDSSVPGVDLDVYLKGAVGLDVLESELAPREPKDTDRDPTFETRNHFPAVDEVVKIPRSDGSDGLGDFSPLDTDVVDFEGAGDIETCQLVGVRSTDLLVGQQ